MPHSRRALATKNREIGSLRSELVRQFRTHAATAGLVVSPCEVGNAAGGWFACECGVSAWVIAGAQPAGGSRAAVR